jgi:hypothetical protein
MIDIPSIISENKKRVEKLFAPYDPILGIGSPLKREKLILDEIGELYLPVEFFSSAMGEEFAKSGSLHRFMERNRTITDIDDAWNLFINERANFDFEFFSAYALTIEDKDTAEHFKFILRKAQRTLLYALESMRLEGVPIRVVLLKARQWGGSTLVQMYMLWIQQRLKNNWHITVCAQVDDASKNIRHMYEVAAANYPSELGSISLKPYAKSSKNIQCIETGGIIGVGSIENPNQFRSYSNKMIHMSELGIWHDTPRKTGAQIASSLKNAIANVPLSMIVEESTAKGVGNYFHKEWTAAEKGRYGTKEENSRYKPVFIPWYEIELYFIKMDESEYPAFIHYIFDNPSNDYERFLWNQGASLENIKWYMEYKTGEHKSTQEMMEEYPTTPKEAFISSGSRVYPYDYVDNARKTVREPIFVGNVEADASTGKKALLNIRLVESINGHLKIWSYPEKVVEIEGKKYKVLNRYAGFGDFGGTWAGADYSTLGIIDRYEMLWGGLPEIVAEWHGHADAMLFAWNTAQIGTMYDNALLALESNTPDKDKNKGGNHFLTAIDQLAGIYPNLYCRNKIESIKQDFVPIYGFHTNTATKTMIIDRHKEALRNVEYVERCKETCDECDYFENKPDGKMGAQDSQHDDRVIRTAGVVWLALEYMDPPKLVEITDIPKSYGVKNTGSLASF